MSAITGLVKGDRVTYTGNPGPVYSSKAMLGKTGSFVRYVNDVSATPSAEVLFDGYGTSEVYAANLTKDKPLPVVYQIDEKTAVTPTDYAFVNEGGLKLAVAGSEPGLELRGKPSYLRFLSKEIAGVADRVDPPATPVYTATERLWAIELVTEKSTFGMGGVTHPRQIIERAEALLAYRKYGVKS